MSDPQPRPAALVVINPSGNRAKALITSTPFTIGRQSENHLTLRDNRISRVHARIIYENGYYIEDQNSRHGTFVNGERVQRKALHSSDRVEFGFDDSYKLLFLYDDDEIGRLLQQMQTGQSLVTGGTNLAKLRAMVEVARTLQNSFAASEVLAAVVDAALTITNTTRGYLILREEGHLKVRVARDQTGRPIEHAPQISLEVLEGALIHRRDFLTVTVPLSDGQTALTVPLVRIRSGDAEETHVVSTGDNTV
ncbi:MAG TPA: FHA domain-containing protein, partial [Bryobacteraceae bacterium]